MNTNRVSVCGVVMSAAAAENVEETNVDVQEDMDGLVRARAMRIFDGAVKDLLATCLDGCDPDREQGWRDYVDALVEAVS